MDDTRQSLRDRLKREIGGFLWLAGGTFLLLCLLSFNNDDPSFNNNLRPAVIANLGGKVGAYLADLFYQLFGLPALLIPLASLFLGWRLLRGREMKLPWYKIGAFLLLLASLGGLLALLLQDATILGRTIRQAGGGTGRVLADLLTSYLNVAGATLFLTLFLLVAVMLSARFSMVLFLEGVLGRYGAALDQRRQARDERRARALRQKGERLSDMPLIAPLEARPQPTAKAEKKKKKDQGVTQEVFEFLELCDTYHRPPLSLLAHDGEAPLPVDREALMMNARILEKKLKDFGVEGEVVEVKPGPVVTMYEFLPAPGIKVNKIAGLSDDLTMALSALSIRIVAPIPGRGVVGIEIPNKERETVYLKEILESEEFQRNGGRLPMALGKDIFGRTVVSDLAKMPHVLVAGSTGSGKSVSINTMILSLVYRATPRDVRIIMIDPKMLELSIYEGIPHLLLPVVTNPKKAALALNWAVREMERRYKLMSDKGVRNIEGYNKKIAREEKEREEGRRIPNAAEPLDAAEEALPLIEIAEGEVLEHGHLPFVVVMVDELADLMMVAGREIEESITRLAQMARASGIHLILATQRPSVDVITGLIKANFPTRISFKVFSRIDSRTILDQMGAEALLGMGDMLFLPPGTGALQRVHGAFVSELEVQRVVDFLKKQGEPEYDRSILAAPPASEGGGSEDEDGLDEKWDEALAIIAETRQASISMLQRRLRLGYNRAARMIEKMEQEGIVGPSDGTSRPREVFIGKIPGRE
jgi:DNA segregation ATPase FtsK/SpoIIIE, S-DNA-T family